MSSENGPSLNCSCVSEVPIPIHGMIDAHAYHSGWNTWPLKLGLKYVRSDGESIPLADIVGTKLPYCERGKMLTVAKGGELVKKNIQMYNSNKGIISKFIASLLEDGIPSLTVTSTLDMEFAHFEGYEGKIIKIGATEKFSAWADQIEGTETVTTLHPLRLFPLFSYDPRRYRRPDKTFSGDKDCEDWDTPFARIIGSKNTKDRVKKTWLGFCMNPTLGFRPFDEFCEHLPDFYNKCEENKVPILAHCAPGGVTVSNVESYKDIKTEERAKKSKIRHDYIKKTIKNNVLPSNFPREALDSNGCCGKDGVVSEPDLARFYTNYGHPRNWVPVLRYFPKLRLCLSGFGGTSVWQYLFAERTADGAMPGKEWIDCVNKLTRFENVYADISGLNIDDKHVKNALSKILDIIQKGYNEFKHLKYKLIFGGGWYLTHLMDLNNGVDYSGYCGKFKQLFNRIDKSGALWERVSLVNPWNFYGFGHKLKDIYTVLDGYNGRNVDTDMLKKMKDVFGNFVKDNGVVGHISACNKKDPVVKTSVPDENDEHLGAVPTVKYDSIKAVERLKKNYGQIAIGKCATHVRWAIEAGMGKDKDGPNLAGFPVSAKLYGPDLIQRVGYTKINFIPSIPTKLEELQIGDIMIFQPPTVTQQHGHIQMWDGEKWGSDFKQPANDFWPGPSYRQEKPKYEFFRIMKQ